jgi:hypothetical protein
MTVAPEVPWWLEWAGGKLMAHPARMVRPANYRSYWPDYRCEINEPERKPVIKPPSRLEVALMDEILLLPILCDDVLVRRVIQFRTLINPHTGKIIMGWTRIATDLHSDRRQVRRWWEKGIEEIDGRLSLSQRSRYSELLPLPSLPA